MATECSPQTGLVGSQERRRGQKPIFPGGVAAVGTAQRCAQVTDRLARSFLHARLRPSLTHTHAHTGATLALGHFELPPRDSCGHLAEVKIPQASRQRQIRSGRPQRQVRELVGSPCPHGSPEVALRSSPCVQLLFCDALRSSG